MILLNFGFGVTVYQRIIKVESQAKTYLLYLVIILVWYICPKYTIL